MRILLLGGTGNLGLRLIPALLAHGHEVIAYVRSTFKLRGLVAERLFNAITTHEGDALDSAGVERALRQHDCDAIMNTAGNRIKHEGEQTNRSKTTEDHIAARMCLSERAALYALMSKYLHLITLFDTRDIY